jgi:DNA-binding transcriptional MerR regulator
MHETFREPAAPAAVYIRQAADMVGVSPTTIRLWEQQRLVAPQRTASGYRLYTLDDVRRLRQIRDLIQVEGLNAAGVRRELGQDVSEPARGADALGPRLRTLRNRQGASLRDLAARTGLSASYISELERSMSAPSMASLQKLAAALGTNIVKLLDEQGPDPEKLVVAAHEQKKVPLEFPGVEIFDLAATQTQLEPLLFHIAPGGGSPTESYSHEGDEFIYVLKGTLTVVLGETSTYRLEERDSMTFGSQRPHRWWNDGTGMAEVLWVNTPPTF